jgi:hypothetical protein
VAELEECLADLARLCPAHEVFRWLGPIDDDVRSSPAALGDRIGRADDLREVPLTQVSPEDAPLWLAFFGTSSLIHGGPKPSRHQIERVSRSLADLGSDTKFFSQGCWQIGRRSRSWSLLQASDPWSARNQMIHFAGGPVPTSAGLCTGGGMIGLGVETAFIFWTEEDD